MYQFQSWIWLDEQSILLRGCFIFYSYGQSRLEKHISDGYTIFPLPTISHTLFFSSFESHPAFTSSIILFMAQCPHTVHVFAHGPAAVSAGICISSSHMHEQAGASLVHTVYNLQNHSVVGK